MSLQRQLVGYRHGDGGGGGGSGGSGCKCRAVDAVQVHGLGAAVLAPAGLIPRPPRRPGAVGGRGGGPRVRGPGLSQHAVGELHGAGDDWTTAHELMSEGGVWRGGGGGGAR